MSSECVFSLSLSYCFLIWGFVISDSISFYFGYRILTGFDFRMLDVDWELGIKARD